MATLAELNVVIGAKIDDFERAMDEVERGVGRAASAVASAGSVLTTGLTLPLGLVAGAALKAAGDMQALEKGFVATYKGSEPLQDALAKVRELAKLPGLGLQEALQGATNLQAAGLSADLARRSLGAFGNALATVGKGKADLEGVALALGQIQAKGKVSAEEINQLAERVPQIREAMKAAFGTADTEALNKAGISATEFVEGVVTQLEKLPKVTGGINNAFENLADAGTTSLAKLGNALNENFDIEGKINALGDLLSGLADDFAALDPNVQRAIFAVAGVAAAIGPVLVAVGALGAAIGPVTAGLSALGITSVAALAPIAAVAAAVGVAAALIISNWDDIVSYFSQGEGAAVFADLSRAVDDAMSAINLALNSIDGGTAFGELADQGGIVISVLDELARVVTAFTQSFAAGLRGVTQLLNGEILDGVNSLGRGVEDVVRTLLGLPSVAEKAGQNVSNFLETGKMGSESWTKALTANLFSLDAVAAAANKANTALAGQIKQTGLLADLEERLKAARAQQQNATNTADITAANQLIQSLEEQIKKLKELGVGSSEAAKAMQKLQEALTTNANLSRALGENGYDYLGGRAAALQSGLNNLIAAGWDPNSAAVKRFADELIKLNGQLSVTEKLQPSLQGIKLQFDAGNSAQQLKDQLGKIGEGLPTDLPFDSSFGDAAQVQAGKYKAAMESLTPAQRAALDSQVAFNTEMGELADTIGQRIAAVGDVIYQAFSNVGAGVSTAGDALRAVFSGIIDALADYMADYGKKLLVLSAGDFAIGNFAGGAAKVAAGTAIIAAAGIGAGFAKSAIGGSSAGGGGRVGSAVPARTYQAPRAQTPTTPPPAANSQPSTQKVTVEVRIRGNDLEGIRQIAVDRFGRVRG